MFTSSPRSPQIIQIISCCLAFNCMRPHLNARYTYRTASTCYATCIGPHLLRSFAFPSTVTLNMRVYVSQDGTVNLVLRAYVNSPLPLRKTTTGTSELIIIICYAPCRNKPIVVSTKYSRMFPNFVSKFRIAEECV